MPLPHRPAVAPAGRVVRRGLAALGAVLIGLYIVRWLAVGPTEIAASDFAVFQRAAALAASHGATSAYDFPLTVAYTRATLGPLAPTLPFDSPPALLPLVWPLHLMPIAAGYRVWSALQLAFMAVAVWLGRSVPASRGARGAGVWMTLGALAIVPVYAAFVEGQVIGLVVLAVAVAAALWTRDRQSSAIAVLTVAMATIAPHLALGLAVWIVAMRRLRLVVVATGAAAAVAAVSLAVAGPDGVRAMVSSMSLVAHERSAANYGGLPAALTLWFGDGRITAVLTAGVEIAAAALAAALADALRRGRLTFEWSFAGAILVSLAMSPHLWLHDLAVLAPAIAWLAVAADRDAPQGAPLVVLGGLVLTAIAAADIGGGLPAWAGRPTGFLLGGAAVLIARHAGQAVRRDPG